MSKWTKEQTEELILRWRRGESQSYIAKAFNISRSAVAGKIDRLGVVRPHIPDKVIVTLPKLSYE